MTTTVGGFSIGVWVNMKIDQFNLMAKELSKFQRTSLAKHFRKFYEVFVK